MKGNKIRLMIAVGLVSIWVLGGGCGPAATPTAPPTPEVAKTVPPEETVAPTPTVPPTPKVEKTLTIGLQRECPGWGPFKPSAVAQWVSPGAIWNKLTARSDKGTPAPILAKEIPTIENGLWKIFDDGTMEVTWHLHEGITWHDGTPLTAEDFVFGWQVQIDPDIPNWNTTALKIDRVEAPDPNTIVVYWKELFPFANDSALGGAYPMPRHILQEVYESGNKEAFINHPYFTTEFVGTGPYVLKEWVPGSHIILEAYDDYFRGRPKIDRIVYKFIPDTTVLVSNIRMGEIDVAEIPFEQALMLEKTEPAGIEIVYEPGFAYLGINRQKENPLLADNRLIKALMYAMDREEIVDALFEGKQPIDHCPEIAARHPLYVDEAVVKYEYNPEKALELFAEAGWTPGPDGVLINEEGQKYELEFTTGAGNAENVRVQSVLVEQWAKVGIKIKVNNLPEEVIHDYQGYLTKVAWPGLLMRNFGGDPTSLPEVFKPGYEYADVGQCYRSETDDLAAQIGVEMSLEKRRELAAEYERLWTDELCVLPLYTRTIAIAVNSGVTGLKPTGTWESDTWNVWEWDIE